MGGSVASRYTTTGTDPSKPLHCRSSAEVLLWPTRGQPPDSADDRSPRCRLRHSESAPLIGTTAPYRAKEECTDRHARRRPHGSHRSSHGPHLRVHAARSPNKWRTSAMSYSATDAESIAAPCLLRGPLLRKASTAACDSQRSKMLTRPGSIIERDYTFVVA